MTGWKEGRLAVGSLLHLPLQSWNFAFAFAASQASEQALLPPACDSGWVLIAKGQIINDEQRWPPRPSPPWGSRFRGEKQSPPMPIRAGEDLGPPVREELKVLQTCEIHRRKEGFRWTSS